MLRTTQLSVTLAVVGLLSCAGTAFAQGRWSPGGVSLPQAGQVLPGSAQFDPFNRGSQANQGLQATSDYLYGRLPRPRAPQGDYTKSWEIESGPATSPAPVIKDRRVGRPIGAGAGMPDGTPLGQRAPVERSIQFDEGVRSRPRTMAPRPAQPHQSAHNTSTSGLELAAGIVNLVGEGIQQVQRQPYCQPPWQPAYPQYPVYPQPYYQPPWQPAYPQYPVYPPQPVYQQPQGYPQTYYQAPQAYPQPVYQPRPVYQPPAYQGFRAYRESP
jgi:hypothetical protein